MQDSTAPSSQGLARNPRLAEFVLALGGFGIGTSEFVIMGLMNRVAGIWPSPCLRWAMQLAATPWASWSVRR